MNKKIDVKVRIENNQVLKLLECRKTKKKHIEDWDIDRLLKEAINEFWFKYGRKEKC